MDFAERSKRYQAIEDYRKRPLVVYATSTRQNVRSMMAGDAVREFIDQVDAIQNAEQIDVLIHSTGGDALVAWKLMSVLRERFTNVAVLVPSAAFSAATVFALGANQIVMHPHASLGPIDPQIQVRLPDGNVRQFAYEDLGAFLKFLVDEVGLSEQVHMTATLDKLFTSVDPVVVGGAKRASDLSTEVGARLLSMHQKDDRRARQIATNLNKSFFAHGDAVSRSRAKLLELQVADPDPNLEALMWAAYLGLESHMELRSPFVPLSVFLSDATAAQSLTPPSLVHLPPDTPAQAAQQIWNNILQQALARAHGAAPEVAFEVVNALVESTRCRSEFRTTGKISCWRHPDGKIQMSIVESEARWRTLPAPKKVS